jgi:RimJ/RimL family protein N-acetyltransferase
MKLIQAEQKDLNTAMAMIDAAKKYLHDCGVDQWQTGYPDKECIRNDILHQKGYFAEEDGQKIGYMCIDFDGEPAYDHLRGTWHTEEPYVVVHRMAFSEDARGRGLSLSVFHLIEEYARGKNIHSFRVDTDEDNHKMKHILAKNGFTYRGTIWFDNSVKIAYDKNI